MSEQYFKLVCDSETSRQRISRIAPEQSMDDPFDSSSDDDSLELLAPVPPGNNTVAPSPQIAEQWAFEALNREKVQSPRRSSTNTGPFTAEERRNDRASFSIRHMSRYMNRMKRRYDKYTDEILNLRFQNETLKAQCRQYRTKVRKIQRLAHAAINKDDDINEGANACLERGELPMGGEIKSDNEDDDPRNTVVYYSTNDLPVE